MGFWDAISKLLPDSIVKVDNRRIINIKDSKVIEINGNTISDPETVKKVFEEIEKNKNEDSLPFQVLHKDLVEDYFEYETVSIKEKESLKQLKEVLDYEDIESIVMARRVLLAKEKGDQNLFNNLMEQLDRNFPKKGRKILNLMNLKYFDELIIPFIDAYRTKYGEKEYKLRYKKFYENVLRFFPLAIFVANYTSEEKLKKELVKRLKLNVPYIKIHALGNTNIRKVENIIEMLRIEENYITKDDRITSPSGIQAQTFEINKRIPKK